MSIASPDSQPYSAEWVRSLSQARQRELSELLTPRTNRFIPHTPTAPQAAFLLLDCKEALYGGAAGGGKSDALLMAALQYVDAPGYSAIIFRRSYPDLARPGAIMDRAASWLANSGAKWQEAKHAWRFPSGAVLSFGHLELDKDKYDYQGAEFQFIGFDELTQFKKPQYTYLFSRLRRLKDSQVPLRMRGASNPGGIGHQWVHQRFFVEGAAKQRVFVPAKLQDNPHLDQAGYRESLQELDPVTRRMLEHGDWDAKDAGEYFQSGWFEVVGKAPHVGPKRVRYWDLAATEAKPGKDPDWTVGVLLAEWRGEYWVEDVRRVRARPLAVETLVRQTAEADRAAADGVEIWMEQEPGSSGVNTIDRYAREVLKGFSFRGNRATGDKVARAKPASAAAEQRRIRLVRGPWLTEFLDEVEGFPVGAHDDQVDALSGAFEKVHQSGSPLTRTEPPSPVRPGLAGQEM